MFSWRTSDAVFSDCDQEYVNYYNAEVLPTSYVKFERFAVEPTYKGGGGLDINYGINYAQHVLQYSFIDNGTADN